MREGGSVSRNERLRRRRRKRKCIKYIKRERERTIEVKNVKKGGEKSIRYCSSCERERERKCEGLMKQEID